MIAPSRVIREGMATFCPLSDLTSEGTLSLEDFVAQVMSELGGSGEVSMKRRLHFFIYSLMLCPCCGLSVCHPPSKRAVAAAHRLREVLEGGEDVNPEEFKGFQEREEPSPPGYGQLYDQFYATEHCLHILAGRDPTDHLAEVFESLILSEGATNIFECRAEVYGWIMEEVLPAAIEARFPSTIFLVNQRVERERLEEALFSKREGRS